jgi:dynein heavy chain 2
MLFPSSLQAQGESLIRKALTELQLWGLQRSFAFLASTDAKATTSNTNSTAGGAPAGSAQSSRSVPLIKDWAGVLSEVGDHQSLVASLKLSPYYAMFKVS